MISAVVITLNEEINIKDCLTALLKLTDDVVVLDSGSTDKTVEIAEKMGAKVIPIKWQGYGPTKNLAEKYVKYPWILSIDADEVLTEELVEELKALPLSRKHIYSINILPNYCGAWIKHSGWFPSYKKRLYYREDVRWDDRKVHENLKSTGDISVKKLDNVLHHFSYRTAEDHVKKGKRYAELGARHLIEKNKKVSIFKQYLGPSFRFFKMYVLKLGFLDKEAGFLLAIREARMVAWRYDFYREFKKK